MAVKAKAQITIFYVAEVEAVYRYYLLQSSTLVKPSVPTSYPPSSSWVVTEPTYTEGSTNSLYYVDCTILTDGTWSYSPVSLSSSYEAAKAAYNKAVNATTRVTELDAEITNLEGEITLRAKKTEVTTMIEEIEIGGRNLYTGSSDFSGTWTNSGSWNADGTDSYGNVRMSRAGTWNGLYKLVSLKAGDVVTLSASVLGDGTAKINCYATEYDDDMTVLVSSASVGTSIVAPTTETRVFYTYNVVNDCQLGMRLENPTASSSLWVSSLKLEKGNKATDWTPAPEDQQAAIDTAAGNLNASIGDIQASLDVTNSTMSDLQSDQDATYKIVTEHETQISQLLQTADGWTMSFETLNTTVTELNDQFATEVNERYEYIRFVDGDIYLGKRPEEGEDDLQLVISNEKISFQLNGSEVAYFSDDALYVTTVYVTRALRFGDFEFAQRSNGNMGLRWVGES